MHVVVPHGLGDSILLTPALREYKSQNPEEEIVIHGLRRLGASFTSLFANSPYGATADMPDPWHDFSSYDEGVQWMEDLAKRWRKYDMNVRVLPCREYPDLHPEYPKHKIFRFAHELGIEVDDPRTEVWIGDKYSETTERVREFHNSVFFHVDGGHPTRDADPAYMLELAKERWGDDIMPLVCSNRSAVEFVRDWGPSIRIWNEDINFAFSVLNVCDHVCVIDSVMCHAAAALGKDQVLWCGREDAAEALQHHKPLISPAEITGKDGYYERRL
jgi:hypothetical protein